MQKKIDKTRLSRLDIVFLVIATLLVYIGAIKLLFIPIGEAFYSRAIYQQRISLGLVFLILLGFDVAWIVLMRLWPLKNIPKRLSIFLTVLVLTLSASVFTCFLVLDAFERAFS